MQSHSGSRSKGEYACQNSKLEPSACEADAPVTDISSNAEAHQLVQLTSIITHDSSSSVDKHAVLPIFSHQFKTDDIQCKVHRHHHPTSPHDSAQEVCYAFHPFHIYRKSTEAHTGALRFWQSTFKQWSKEMFSLCKFIGLVICVWTWKLTVVKRRQYE